MKTKGQTIKELERSVKGKGREAHIAGHEAEDILHDLNDLKEREIKDKSAGDWPDEPEVIGPIDDIPKQTFPSSPPDWRNVELIDTPFGTWKVMGNPNKDNHILDSLVYNIDLESWPMRIRVKNVVHYIDGQGGGGGFIVDPSEEEGMERMYKGLDVILDNK